MYRSVPSPPDSCLRCLAERSCFAWFLVQTGLHTGISPPRIDHRRARRVARQRLDGADSGAEAVRLAAAISQCGDGTAQQLAASAPRHFRSLRNEALDHFGAFLG